jgi:nucleoside-diphosphate-sugar epimerase
MSTNHRIFVAGATGVLGRRAVRQLVDAGHQVTGLARSAEKAELVRSLGATPVQVDLFDAGALKDAAAGHDVVANLATHIPPLSKAAFNGAWNENSRIRSEGSRNLVDAALSTGAGRYIQEGISFMYEDRGDAWIDEDVPMVIPELGRAQLDAEREAQRFTEAGGVGVVLRFGQFYAPDAFHTTGMIKMARRRVAPALGDPDSYAPNIHIDDAASAVVAALGAPAGVYNVVDDDPVTKREFAAVMAAALGKKPPHHLPATAVKAVGKKADYLIRSQRVSNRRFKDATGWSPRYPSVREGLPPVIAAATS